MARSGDFRRLVTLQARSATQDSAGSQLNTWYDVEQLWADMNPLHGRELVNAQALFTEVTSEISVRYSAVFADPKAIAAMRLCYAGRYFNILGMINEQERNHIVKLFCKEGVSDA